jgi:hypothetical protein
MPKKKEFEEEQKEYTKNRIINDDENNIYDEEKSYEDALEIQQEQDYYRKNNDIYTAYSEIINYIEQQNLDIAEFLTRKKFYKFIFENIVEEF